MKKLFLFIVLIFALSLVSAQETYKQNTCISLHQICSNCTFVNFTSMKYPNGTLENYGKVMTKNGQDYNYTFCLTNQLGEYIWNNCGDKDGSFVCENLSFNIKSTSLTFLIFLYGLAIIFFIATLVVDEEFLVYISGVLFLIGGIYIMINGLEDLNDTYSRVISFVSLGVGMLFTIGAYVFNSYSGRKEEEEDD